MSFPRTEGLTGEWDNAGLYLSQSAEAQHGSLLGCVSQFCLINSPDYRTLRECVCRENQLKRYKYRNVKPFYLFICVFKNNYEITMEGLSMKCDPCLGRGTLEETSSSVLVCVCVSSDIINIWEGHVACNPAWCCCTRKGKRGAFKKIQRQGFLFYLSIIDILLQFLLIFWVKIYFYPLFSFKFLLKL